MPSIPNNREKQTFVYEIALEGCPKELLQSMEALKSINSLNTIFELSFGTITQLETFTRILNREEDEERVANELKLTYFHNIRGKLTRQHFQKHESFTEMKKIKFTSTYHVNLFLKFYETRIKQLQNEYKYVIAPGGKDGWLNVYLMQGEQISSMFVNEIREMKRKLSLLEVKDEVMCEKFAFSDKLGKELENKNIFYELWYRGKDSTMIFYSDTNSLRGMKTLIHQVSKFHVTIIKMVDQRFSFLLNYLLFVQLEKSFKPEAKNLESIDFEKIQFNSSKLGIVIHDKHVIFEKQIVEEILQKMKKFMLVTVRGKNVRKYFNSLKRQYTMADGIHFCYSKKSVCISLDIMRLKSIPKYENIFSSMYASINQESQITLNWFHLQADQLEDYRHGLVQRLVEVLSTSRFHVENFQNLIEEKDLKCVLKIKNCTKDGEEVEAEIRKVMGEICDVWLGERQNKKTDQKELIRKDKVNLIEENEKRPDPEDDIQSSEDDSSESQQSQSCESQYDQDENSPSNQVDPTQKSQKSQPNSTQTSKLQLSLDDQSDSMKDFTNYLLEHHIKHGPKYFTPKSEKESESMVTQWKEGSKSLRKSEEELINQSKIFARVKVIEVNQKLKQKVMDFFVKISTEQNKSQTVVKFCQYDEFDIDRNESDKILKRPIKRLQEMQLKQKYIVYAQMIGSDINLPLCSIQVLKKL